MHAYLIHFLQGWGLHLVASVSEWVVGLSIVLFFLTFTSEFRRGKLSIKAEASEGVTNDDDASLLVAST